MSLTVLIKCLICLAPCSLRKLLDTVVTAPGTKVVSNAQSGTNVVAPGTQVTSTQGGTTVRAPLTNVDVSKGDGVHVKAPGTLVDLEPNGRWVLMIVNQILMGVC